MIALRSAVFEKIGEQPVLGNVSLKTRSIDDDVGLESLARTVFGCDGGGDGLVWSWRNVLDRADPLLVEALRTPSG